MDLYCGFLLSHRCSIFKYDKFLVFLQNFYTKLRFFLLYFLILKFSIVLGNHKNMLKIPVLF